MIRKASGLLTIFGLLTLVACDGWPDPALTSGRAALSAMQDGVESGLDNLMAEAQPTVDGFVGLPLAGADADQKLTALAKLPHIVDALTLDAQAIVQAIQPAQYDSLLGETLNDQPHIAAMSAMTTPRLSNFFLALEGVPSIAVEFPLHTSDSSYQGSVSLLIDHVAWFAEIADAALGGTPFGADLLQPDGVVLWDQDPSLIGKNVFTDPTFQNNSDFVRQAHDIVGTEQGTGSYVWSPDSATSVPESCVWTTIRRANAEWRLMVWWSQTR
jgi:hypothetical protein